VKYLIVYYSRTGKNKKIARLIKGKIGGDIEEIVDLRNRKGFIGWLRSGMDASLNRKTKINDTINNPSNYDSIILGTPVWAGKITPAIRTYLLEYKNEINDYFIFSVSGFGEKNKKISAIISSILVKESSGELFISDKELKTGKYMDKFTIFIKMIEEFNNKN